MSNSVETLERIETRRAQTTGGGAVVGQLIAQGIDTVFGLPGVQTYSFFDALEQARDGIRLINPRHEQACSHMAFGAARSTGTPAVYSVVPGPGVLNAGAGLLNAYSCSAPVLCVTGQVPSDFLGRGRGHLHEMPDQLGTLRGVTKWAARIDHGATAAPTIAEAFRQMLSGRQGPAAVEMPWDIMDAPAPAGTVTPGTADAVALADDASLDDAAAALATARRPLIIVGAGALDASAEVLRLARRLGAPVVSFRSGRGIVSEDDPLGVSIVAARTLWEHTDTYLVLGSRMELVDWRWSWEPPGATSIRVDIDPAEFIRRPTDIAVLGDARAAASALFTLLDHRDLAAVDQSADIAAAKLDAAQRVRTVQPQLDFLDAIRDVAPRDAIICDELTQVGFASWFGLPIYQPRTFLTSGYQGSLGSGFLTALGAQAVNPDRAVISITGDGGFLFGMQDLATAAEHGLAVVTIVFNNGVYGNVMRDQDQRFDGRRIAVDLGTPDLVGVAEAFGVRATRVADPAALRTALAAALDARVPTLIDVTIAAGSESNPWPLIHPAPKGAARA